MDELDAQIEAIKAELAALRSQPVVAATEPASTEAPWYTPAGVEQLKQQFRFDIPAALATAGAGTIDVLSLPFTGLARALGADPETMRYFALSKELQKAKEAIAPTLGVQPDTAAQEALSFLAPSPLSKAGLVSQAGTGLASYLGMKGAEAVAPESPYAGLAGALLGPAAVSGAARTAGATTKAATAIRPGVGVALGSDEAMRAAAQAELLRQAGPTGIERLKFIQEFPEAAVGTGNVPLTAAEIVSTPEFAQYQQEIGKKVGATDILQAAREARGTQLQAALEKFGVAPETGDFAIALRDAATEAVKKKAASEGNILQSLGLTEEAAAVTKTERGAALREAINKRLDDATELADEAWQAVPKQTKLDVSGALQETLNNYNQFGDLAKASVTGEAQRVINKIQDVVTNQGGIATVNDLQDIRSAAGRAMTEAAGKNPTQSKLMSILRDNIDNYGISYLPSAGADPEALTKLGKAIDATRNLKQTFGEDVVGQITATRRYKPKLQTSKVIDRAVANPENAADIIGKFGKNSVEATELRLEMLSRLDKANNPTEFLGRNKDTLKAIFGSDYVELEKFAQQKGRGTGLEQFERITDTQIPNKIFADVKQANAFMQRFEGTELELYARSKFIKTKLLKAGNPISNLETNKQIAKRLFKDDYTNLQKVLNDLELSKTPDQLAKLASKGQAITSQSLTTLGAIAASRGVIATMKQQGPTSGGIIGALTGGGVGGLIGAGAGAVISKAGQAREVKMDTLIAEMLANPSLIKFAAAPPTETNIRRFNDIAQTLQRGGVAGANVEPTAATIEPENINDIDATIESVKRELEALRTIPAPTESVKVGKQNISIPTGKEFAPPDLVKAVIEIESGGKPEAISPKGAAGLMQLMKPAAKEVGVTNRLDPEQNIQGGSRYLQKQIDEFGKLELALAAYNWGPSNIRKAKKKLEEKGKRVTWANVMQVTEVPMETRMYVNKVLREYRG